MRIENRPPQFRFFCPGGHQVAWQIGAWRKVLSGAPGNPGKGDRGPEDYRRVTSPARGQATTMKRQRLQIARNRIIVAGWTTGQGLLCPAPCPHAFRTATRVRNKYEQALGRFRADRNPVSRKKVNLYRQRVAQNIENAVDIVQGEAARNAQLGDRRIAPQVPRAIAIELEKKAG